MCAEWEAAIAGARGLDGVMLGLGWNGHIASRRAGAPVDPATSPVWRLAETVDHIPTDEVRQGAVSNAALTRGIPTIMATREVGRLVRGPPRVHRSRRCARAS